MPTEGTISVNTEVRSAGWTKGLGEAGMGLKKFVGDAERDFHKFTGLFVGIKDALKNPLSVKWGAPIAAGVGLMGKYAAGALDVATALRTGESVAKVFGETVNKIPIVGQFKQAGEAIRELFTGEQAARIERQKSAEHLDRMVAAYRQMALDAALLGKYGHELAKQQAENATNAELSAHVAKRKDVMREVMAQDERNQKVLSVDIHGRDITQGDLQTPAERAELQRKKDLIELSQKEDVKIIARGNQKLKDLATDNAQEQREFLRSHMAEAEAIKAGMDEVALRRSGKVLESAIHRIQAEADAKSKALKGELDETKLRGLSGPETTARMGAVYTERAMVEKAAGDTIAVLRMEAKRRASEIEKDSEEKRTQILAEAGIDRLRLVDEQANAINERRGVAARSHLAEAAQIEEAYRKQLAEAQKAHRDDDERRNDANDPLLKSDLDAANQKRLAARGLLDTKSIIEARKNEQNHLRETRKLWEENGNVQEKYLARTADINEEFQKYGDKKLRARQIEKLDASTFDELKKLNPDSGPKVELYGRTLSYAGIPSGDRSSDIANKQLEELKKQNAATEDHRTLLQKLVDYFTGTVSEVNI